MNDLLKINDVVADLEFKQNDECIREDLDKGKEYHCNQCKDELYLFKKNDIGEDVAIPCECREEQLNRIATERRIRKSNLKDNLKRYRIDNYELVGPLQKFSLKQALAYVKDPQGWFCTLGQAGAGKTHISTIITNEFIEQGKDVRYVVWTEVMKEVKTDYLEARAKYSQQFIDAEVLYLDDFLNSRKKRVFDQNIRDFVSYYQPIPDVEYEFAFEIINARYNNPDKITIISSNKLLDDLYDVSDALAGRIEEMGSKMEGGTLIQISEKPEHNFRRRENMKKLREGSF